MPGWIDAVLVQGRPVQISAGSLWGIWVILRDRWAVNSDPLKSGGQKMCIDGGKAFIHRACQLGGNSINKRHMHCWWWAWE